MSADRFKSVWESLIFILLDGNTEAAFTAELVTAVSTEIGMGFVPISICWHAMNSNLIPGVALQDVADRHAARAEAQPLDRELTPIFEHFNPDDVLRRAP